MRHLRRPAQVAAALLLVLAVVAAVLWFAPSGSYIFLPDRAHPVAPLVTVQGAKRGSDPGAIYFVDIFVRKATLAEKLFPWLREGAEIVPASALLAPGASDAARARQDQLEMTRSQQIAAALALKAAGYKVVAKPTGALVDDVGQHVPAAGLIQPTDVIVSVDGKPVRQLTDLRRLLGAYGPGDTVELGLKRGTQSKTVNVKLAPDPQDSKRGMIGVIVSQAADIHLPRKVTINAGGVGGPSAGLAFALDVLEKLGWNVDHGCRIAATGEVDLAGDVLPIGGIKQKMIGVRRTGIDVFLVPAGDNATEAKRFAGRVRVIPVSSFQQALHALATMPVKCT
ncbi:MAG: PDZ domain-containing protein [Gaiellaceae bacterium]